MFAVLQVETDDRRSEFRRKMRTKCEFICKFCQRRFTKPYNLMIHERSHKDDVTFTCEACGKTFKRQDNLKQHRFCQSRPADGDERKKILPQDVGGGEKGSKGS